MRARLLVAVFPLLGLAVVPSAFAASASVRATYFVDYAAAAGETNSVTVARPSDQVVRILDATATITPGPGCTTLSAHEVECSVAVLFSVVVEVGDGEDVVAHAPCAGSSCSELVVDGGDGNDVLVGGHDHDELSGGRGDDRIEGRGGIDWLDAWPSAGSEGADVLLGGDGEDLVSYRERRASVTVDLDGAADDGEPGEGDLVGADVEIVEGGGGDDKLTGNALGNKLAGHFGRDVLRGGGGNDGLWGDELECDWSSRRDGDDVIFAGRGDDWVEGCLGDDRIDLGPGSDFGSGDPGADVIFGRSGSDSIDGWRGHDRLYGNAGRDYLDGHGGDDRVHGGEGNDHLEGYAGRDVVIGGVGRDRLFGEDEHGFSEGYGRDSLYACDGQADTVDGGPRFDLAFVDSIDRVSLAARRRCASLTG